MRPDPAPTRTLRPSARMSMALVAALSGWAGRAGASVSPDGGEFVMADWMLLSFLVFFGVALLVFLIAVRRGLLRRMEDAKYHLLSVEAPDYYTPDWAKEE